MRLNCIDVEVKWSCRGLYPSKDPEGGEVDGGRWWWVVVLVDGWWVGSGIKACAWWILFRRLEERREGSRSDGTGRVGYGPEKH